VLSVIALHHFCFAIGETQEEKWAERLAARRARKTIGQDALIGFQGRGI
jgi:hypothetical protein